MENTDSQIPNDTTRQAKPWWIKERYNPQLGTYYVGCGQMSKTEAKKHEKTLYGDNAIYRFDSEELYRQEMDKLRANGESVQ